MGGGRLTYFITYTFKILVYMIKNRIQRQVVDWEKIFPIHIRKD